ncbi:C4b-binding protein alpha chain-like isoform X2 [Erpetoichthys calabaricus]|uniref:C4b-binding protein alpha chain-like isoform X2 n=1 Tax=Erpetoichthys calabaricus TaxID=27687 RepID=UPI0022346007|nr:C4b-binding protein alpha chain-like isoform X2 [Erpetoichthys calabaricus]
MFQVMSVFCILLCAAFLGASASSEKDDFCPIPFFENGMVTPEVGSSYSYGISAIFSCNDFYILEGPTTATCEIDRTWQPSPPVCVLDPCQVSGILNKMRCAKRKFVKWVKEKTSDFDF